VLAAEGNAVAWGRPLACARPARPVAARVGKSGRAVRTYACNDVAVVGPLRR